MQNLLCILLIVMFGAVAQVDAATLEKSHVFYALFDNTGWSYEEDGPVHVNRDGTHWVKTGDGRIRPGTWWLDEQGNICVINAGIYESCQSVTMNDGTLKFVDVNDPSFVFHLEIREGREEFLTVKQKALHTNLLRSKGTIDGGAEFLHLQKSGALSVVQKEGWLKMGGFWFDVDGRACDNVNGRVDCIEIISVDAGKAVLSFEGEEFDITFDE